VLAHPVELLADHPAAGVAERVLVVDAGLADLEMAGLDQRVERAVE